MLCVCVLLSSLLLPCGDASHVEMGCCPTLSMCVCVIGGHTHGNVDVGGSCWCCWINTHTHVPLLLSIYLHVVLCCGDVCVHRCVACLMRVSMSMLLILYGLGYLGRMGSCVGHNPKHTFTHPHTSSIHTHGSASMLHACRLCVGMCVWIEMWGSTHTQLRWNVRIWGMGCTLPHTQACLGCGVCVCSPFLISPLVFSSMYD